MNPRRLRGGQTLYFMTLTHRRIIYAIFMLIFLVAAPIIILRVSGYRYSRTRNTWQKTGMIFLETKPTGVNVYLNNELVGTKTPLRLKDLAANKYTLRIEQAGFQKWEKEVEVVDGQTVEIQYVRLFREAEIPQLIAAGKFALTDTNNNQLLGLIEKSNRQSVLVLVDLATGETREIKTITRPAQDFKKIELIENGARAAIYADNDLSLISLNGTGVEISLREKLGVNKKISNIKLPANGSDSVYYVSEGKLKKYNWSLGKEEVVLTYQPVDYLLAGTKMYFLDNESLDRTILKAIDQNNSSQSEAITTMERGVYQIEEINNEFLTIKNKTRQEILVVDLKENKNEVIRNVDYYQWSESGTEMIFGNNYELWVYRPLQKQNKYTLFTRVSNPITAVNWYSVESHIFYVENGSIKTVENIDKDGLSFGLGQYGQINEIAFNQKGDGLFFTGEVAKTEGLYKMEIQ